jgi:hypothetical protein
VAAERTDLVTERFVRVERNCYGSAMRNVDWLIECSLCKPGFGFPGASALSVIVTATKPTTWADAVAFAHRHAAKHAESTCPTCGHTPSGAIPIEDHVRESS